MFLSLRKSQLESERGRGGVQRRLCAIGESPLDKDTDISHRYTRVYMIVSSCPKIGELILWFQNFKESLT